MRVQLKSNPEKKGIVQEGHAHLAVHDIGREKNRYTVVWDDGTVTNLPHEDVEVIDE